jgi:hypothetical protein
MVDAATPIDYSVLHYGDSIAFQVDGGFLACPSFYYEAIPDASEAVRYARQSVFVVQLLYSTLHSDCSVHYL